MAAPAAALASIASPSLHSSSSSRLFSHSPSFPVSRSSPPSTHSSRLHSIAPFFFSAPPRRKACLKVSAAACYPASITWWKKGNQANMQEVHSAQQFVEALATAAAQDKLVLVEFYSVGCRSCKAMHPKVCQIAADNPDIDVLKVNFYDNHALCKSLNVNILPFFHFYRGQEGLIDAFSCSLTKVNKLRQAVAKYKLLRPSIAAPGPVEPVKDLNDLLHATANVAACSS